MDALTRDRALRLSGIELRDDHWKAQVRDPGGEDGGQWISAGGLAKDALNLAGKIDLDEGESFVGSDKIKNEHATIRAAVTERGGRRLVRLGIGDGVFGGRDDEGGPWRGRDTAAEENARRAPLLAEFIALQNGEGDMTPAEQARFDALDEMDLNDVVPSGHTARLDDASATRLRASLADDLDKALRIKATEDARFAEIDRLEAQREPLRNMDRKWTDAEDARWDDLTAQIEALEAADPYPNLESLPSFEGSVPAEWADIHYRVEYYDGEVHAVIGAVPHNSGRDFADLNGNDETASLDPADIQRLIRLLGRVSGEGSRSVQLLVELETRNRSLRLLGIETRNAAPDAALVLSAALDLFLASEVRARKWDPSPSVHPRDPGGEDGGQFVKNPIGAVAKLLDRLKEWSAGDGPDDPFDGVEREPLRKAAVGQGLKIRRGADREEIAEQLKNHVRDEMKRGRGEEVPTHRLTLTGGAPPKDVEKAAAIAATAREIDSLIREDASRETMRERLRTLSDRLGTSTGLQSQLVAADTDRDRLRFAIAGALREAGITREGSGESAQYVLRRDGRDIPLGGSGDHRLRDQDVGVYQEKSGKVSLYRESSSGQRGSKVVSVDSLADLEAWGRDNDEPQVVQWAASERTPAKKATKAAPKPPPQPTTKAARDLQPGDMVPSLDVADDEPRLVTGVSKAAGGDVIVHYKDPRSAWGNPGAIRLSGDAEVDLAASERGGVKPVKKVAPRKGAPPAVSPDQIREIEVENRIRAIFREKKQAGGWASLTAVREGMPDVDRAELDRALERLAVTPGVQVIPWDNRKALNQADHDAALRFGGQDNHAIRFEDPSDRPLPGAAPKKAPGKKAVPAKAPAAKVAPAAEYAAAIRHGGGEGEIVRLLDADASLTPPRLRELAHELGIDIPADVRSRQRLQSHIATEASRRFGPGDGRLKDRAPQPVTSDKVDPADVAERVGKIDVGGDIAEAQQRIVDALQDVTSTADLRRVATAFNLPLPGDRKFDAAGIRQYIAENMVRDRTRWTISPDPRLAPSTPRKAPAKRVPATPKAHAFELAPGLTGALGRKRQRQREEALMDVAETGTLSVIQSPDSIETLESLQANGYVRKDGKWWRLTDKGKAYVDARKAPADLPVPATPAPAKAVPDAPLTGDSALAAVPVKARIRTGANSEPSTWSATGFDGLPGADREAVAAVTAYLRRPGLVNRRLRSPSEPIHEQSLDELLGGPVDTAKAAAAATDADRHIAAMDRIMDQSRLPSDIVTYRGVALAALGDLADDPVGHEWTDPGFASTSTTRTVAEHSFTGRSSVLLHIVAPEGTPALSLEGLGESEVLLGRGLRYRVVADRGLTDGGARQFDVEIVPAAPADLSTMDTESARDALDLKKVPELKAMLKAQGLPVSGTKRQLVDRLVGHHGGGGVGPKGDGPGSNLPPARRTPATPVPIHDLIDATRAQPHPGQRYRHGWIPVGPVEGRNLIEDMGAQELAEALSGVSGGRAIMTAIAARQGFDGPPEVGGSADVDRVIASGGREVWRGAVSSDMSAAAMQEQLRTGPAYFGEGMFGNGIYLVTDSNSASDYADGTPGSMIRGALRADARIISLADLRAQHSVFIAGADAETASVFEDPARYAAALGYDAISAGDLNHGQGTEELVVLNRTALTFSTEDPVADGRFQPFVPDAS